MIYFSYKYGDAHQLIFYVDEKDEHSNYILWDSVYVRNGYQGYYHYGL